MSLLQSAARARSAFEPAFYNKLPLLEDASRFVHANGLVDKMEASVGKIFVAHGVHECWGTYLKHHHWNVGHGEIPGEDLVHRTAADCMMRPVPNVSNGFVPITYDIDADGYHALEFSSTRHALLAHQLLAENRQFLRELREVMVKSGLYKHFGLGVIRPTVKGPEYCWVEHTADAKRFSEMKYVSTSEVDFDCVIQTSWAFDGQLGHRCRYRCGNCLSIDGGHAGKLQ